MQLLSKVCRVHVVLSTLYQEEMVREEEVKNLNPAACPWRHLICTQCTKPHRTVASTDTLLAEVQRNEERNLLQG